MSDVEQPCHGPASFSATHWSIIYAARKDSPAALETLCRRYWYPLYAYIRRTGHSKEEAEDLVQGFFADLLSRDFLSKITPEKGKFRYFLLACYKNYSSHVRERAMAEKRGGGRVFLPLEIETVEGKYQIEPIDQLTPDKLYERRWFQALFENALAEFAREYDGREEIFRVLEPFLRHEAGDSCKEAAQKIGMAEGAFRTQVSRKRSEFMQILSRHIAQTVSSPSDVQEEVKELLAAIS